MGHPREVVLHFSPRLNTDLLGTNIRFDRIRMFNAVNREAGYKEIEIYSPREVTQHEER